MKARHGGEVMQTISDEYRRQQQDLHRDPGYGVMALNYGAMLSEMMDAYQAKSICDYGAGKMRLKEALDKIGKTGYDYFPFDPAFPEYGEAKPADIVACIDVLEHIEPDYLPNVIADLARLTLKRCFMMIAVKPSSRTLPDGRNAHLILKPASWWLPRLCEKLEPLRVDASPDGIMVLASRKVS